MGGSIAALVLTSLAIMGSPGPATISLVALGSSYGVRRVVPYLAGIVVGTTIVLLAVATGITAVLLAVPALRIALLAGSLAYLAWLAYRIATAPPLGAAPTALPSFGGGAVLGVANPKAWPAIAAVFASAHLGAATKLAVLVAMIVAINSSWLAAGSSLAPLLRDARRARIVNVALAVLLLGAAALTLVH